MDDHRPSQKRSGKKIGLHYSTDRRTGQEAPQERSSRISTAAASRVLKPGVLEEIRVWHVQVEGAPEWDESAMLWHAEVCVAADEGVGDVDVVWSGHSRDPSRLWSAARAALARNTSQRRKALG